MVKSISGKYYTDQELIDQLCYIARVSNLSHESCDICDQASQRLEELIKDWNDTKEKSV